MDYELLSILISFGIFIFGRLKYTRAKKLLNESQNEIASLVFSKARQRIKYPSLILIALLGFGLIVLNDSRQLIYFIFFLFSFILAAVYYLRLKKQLPSSNLPDKFIDVVSKINLYYLCGLAFVVITFAANI